MSEELNLDGMLSSGNRRDITRFKVTEGRHIFRILPPFGTNHGNVPSRQIQLHWGFFKKDGKTSPIPGSYTHEGYCPICERVREKEALAERVKAQGDEEQSKAILKDAGNIKVRRTYLLNAANKAGEVGILELTKTSIDALVDLMKQYQNKYGKNPVSLQTGIWFVFNRSGKGFNTKYSVEYHKTMLEVGGEQVEKNDNSALSPNIIENFDKLAYDIHKMYPAVASSDLLKILNGAPIDEVLVKKQAASPAAVETATAAPVATPPAQVRVSADDEVPDDLLDNDDIMSILNGE
jgi:hypothetical protein